MHERVITEVDDVDLDIDIDDDLERARRSQWRTALLFVGLGGAALGVRQLLRRRAATAGSRQGIHVVKSMTINRPRELVYAFWRDFTNLPRFMAHLESVKVLDERRSRWTVKGPGKKFEWDAEITEDVPNRMIAWRSLVGSDVSNSGTVRFVTAPGGRGTEIHVDLRYDPPAGAFGATIARLFGKEPSQQVEGDLRRFKQVIETGDVVHSDASVHRGMHAARPPASDEYRSLPVLGGPIRGGAR